MTHGNPHDEAEHASHLAHDPFDKRVAMSMVVIAALLATVKVVGHRAHNDTLGHQIKAGVAQSQAGAAHTQESDLWNFFQAKKMREVLARLEANLLLQRMEPGKGEPSPGPLPNRDARMQALTKELTDEKVADPEAEAKRILDGAEKRYRALAARYSGEQADRVVDAEITAERYRAEGKGITAKALAKKGEAEKHDEASKEQLEKSNDKHHQTNYFDFGELGVELALVLSSVAILTKRKGYWYAGLALGVVGVAAVGLGFLAH